MSDTTYKKGMVLQNIKQGTKHKIVESHMELQDNRFPVAVYTVEDLSIGKIYTIAGNWILDRYFKLIEW